jgi:hypothetical protein
MTEQVKFSPKVETSGSTRPPEGPGSPGQETPAEPEGWTEIFQHFWVLGESLNTAMKTAWQREENQQQLHKLQTGLQEVAGHVSHAVKEVVETPEFQKAQAAGEQAFQEIQPYLLTVLRQFRSSVDKLISQLEQPAPVAGEPVEPETTLLAEEPAALVKDSPPNTVEL